MKRFVALVLAALSGVSTQAANPNFLLARQSVALYAEGRTNLYSVTARTYNRQGQLVRNITETDINFDGVLDIRDTTTGFCDSRGYPTQFVSQAVWINSGDQYSSNTQWLRYDHRGQITNIVSESPETADAAAMASHASYRYDHQGNMTQMSVEWQSGSYRTTDLDTRTYSACGDIVESVRQTTSNVAGPSTTWTFWRYFNRGSPAQVRTLFDVDGDGVPDNTIEATYQCDRTGMVMQSVSRTLDRDGNVLASETDTYDYDRHRNPVVFTQAIDDGNDGMVDRVVVVNSEYVHP